MIADIHAAPLGAVRPSVPPPDLSNLAYLEDMRSRLGELAQVARAGIPPDAPAEALAARMRFIDRMDAGHDYLARLAVQIRKEAAK